MAKKACLLAFASLALSADARPGEKIWPNLDPRLASKLDEKSVKSVEAKGKDVATSQTKLAKLVDEAGKQAMSADALKTNLAQNEAVVRATTKKLKLLEEDMSEAADFREQALAKLRVTMETRIIKAKQDLAEAQEGIEGLESKVEKLKKRQADAEESSLEAKDSAETFENEDLKKAKDRLEKAKKTAADLKKQLAETQKGSEESDVGKIDDKIQDLSARLAGKKKILAQQEQGKAFLGKAQQHDEEIENKRYAEKKADLMEKLSKVEAHKQKAEDDLKARKAALKQWKVDDAKMEQENKAKVEKYKKKVEDFNNQRLKVFNDAGAKLGKQMAQKSGFDSNDWAWSGQTSLDDVEDM
eukprot:TRINITY_DN48690_c0_g1_i1.p1 TRINITY_DN48690_c0_g1~~TRINITY_DN48690_c0_g1_i1.p1  ORF type:complete len:357 (-),score=149.49 TRINITY_DN48690_c0_g1_i1:38-1108(-)